MVKTTVYLPDDLKAGLARAAERSGKSEAELIRQGIRQVLATTDRPKPRVGMFAHGGLASRVDEILAEGFGRD